MTKLIEVKSDPPVFEIHMQNRKNFDKRKNDRNYEEGDILLDREFDRGGNGYTGREFVARILFVMRAPLYGLTGDDVILSLHPITIKTKGYLEPIL